MTMLSKLRDYAKLMRVANVFTAISNVWMGMVVAAGTLPGKLAISVTLTSALLYLAGMVLNDVFDAELDARERPERPIPSGRVSLSIARALGWTLLAAGVAAGWLASQQTPTMAPGVTSWLLAGLIVAYNAGLKQSSLGPLVMGACRFANVLLGLSVGSELLQWRFIPADVNITPAIAMGVYIWGVSWFARSEVLQSDRRMLTMASIGTMLGLAILAAMPFAQSSIGEQLVIEPLGWIVLWIVVTGSILRRMVVAILQPAPKNVQRAVGHAILSIIVIDAAICLGFATPFWALAILALLAPAMLLAQAFKVT